MTVHVDRLVSIPFYLDRPGVSPSGKAPVFGTGMRRFESCHPKLSSLIHPGEDTLGPNLECGRVLDGFISQYYRRPSRRARSCGGRQRTENFLW